MSMKIFVLVILILGAGAPAQAAGFAGFPDIATKAKAGEIVLAPSYNWIQEAASNGGEKTNFIFYQQTMVEPGAAESRVSFGRTEQTVPNSYLVTIARGGRAAVGDIVLTWWQSGSGMKRAIVTSAADPARPVVRYLDINYDNPAKSRDGKSTIGKMDEALAADSFIKLATGDVGTVYACQEGPRKTRWQLIARDAKGEMLMLGFVGKMRRFAAGACTATPLKPTVKPGQKVEVEFGGGFTNAVVDRVDPAIGRVFVTLFKRETAVPFGDVIPN